MERKDCTTTPLGRAEDFSEFLFVCLFLCCVRIYTHHTPKCLAFGFMRHAVDLRCLMPSTADSQVLHLVCSKGRASQCDHIWQPPRSKGAVLGAHWTCPVLTIKPLPKHLYHFS